MNLTFELPHFATLSKRVTDSSVHFKAISTSKPIHLAIDATSLKVCGEGEWIERIRGLVISLDYLIRRQLKLSYDARYIKISSCHAL